MNYMDKLPSSNPSIPQGSQPQPAASSGLNKEIAPVSINQEVSMVQEIGKESPLPPEVVKAGVTMRSDSVTLPPAVSNLGVAPAGTYNQVTPPVPSIKLPLTDDQIANGLQQSLSDSWRWLAQWCVRQLQQIHIQIKSVPGGTVRTTTE
jgi:hypothetical protein